MSTERANRCIDRVNGRVRILAKTRYMSKQISMSNLIKSILINLSVQFFVIGENVSKNKIYDGNIFFSVHLE